MLHDPDSRRLAWLLYKELERDPWVPDDNNLFQRLYRAIDFVVDCWLLEKLVARRVKEFRCSFWSPQRAAEMREEMPTRAEQEEAAIRCAMHILRRHWHPAFPTWEQAGLPADRKPHLVRGLK